MRAVLHNNISNNGGSSTNKDGDILDWANTSGIIGFWHFPYGKRLHSELGNHHF